MGLKLKKNEQKYFSGKNLIGFRLVERVEVKDVRVPAQLMRAMAAEAEAAREARAKIIAAEGEEKASTSLRNAANIISENKGALQVDLIRKKWRR